MPELVAVRGRVLDARIEGANVVLVVNASDVRDEGGPVDGWRRHMVAEGESFPRFVGAKEMARGLRLGGDVQLQAQHEGGVWRVTALD